MARRRAGGDGDRPRGADLKVHRYVIDGVWEVLAGRTDADNDRLSLKVARANDWWFHVSGQPGSHVILRVPDGQEPSKDILKQAASVAAWHSRSRAGGVVTVSATLARNVSKPRGAKPGTVTIRREIRLKVRPGLPEAPGEDAGDDRW